MRRLKSVERAVNPEPLLEHNFNRLDSSLIWDKYSFEFSLFGAVATEETVQLGTIPSDSIFMGLRFTPEEAWGGGALTGVTLEFGISGDPDQFLSAYDVFGSPAGYGFNWSPQTLAWVSSSPFNVTARVTGGNVADLASGAGTVWVGYCDLK